MEHRARIFSAWTAPSVRTQTVRDFDWLLLIDPRTPRRWRHRILKIAGFRRASLVEVPLETSIFPEQNSCAAIVRAIRPLVDPTAELLLTTRLDTDDVLHRRAIERVRAVAAEVAPPAVIDCTRRWYLGRGGLSVCEQPFERGVSPFASLLEPVGGGPVRTVHYYHHSELAAAGPVQRMLDGPWWIHLVHTGPGGNSSKRNVLTPRSDQTDQKTPKVGRSLRGRLVPARIPAGFGKMTAARYLALGALGAIG